MVKCSIKCCPRNANADIGISFFRFPAESARADEWMRALGRPDLQGLNAEKLHQSKYRVCNVHFHTNSFSSMLMNRLKKEAVPVNFPYAAIPGPYFEVDINEIEKFSADADGESTISANEEDSNSDKQKVGENEESVEEDPIVNNSQEDGTKDSEDDKTETFQNEEEETSHSESKTNSQDDQNEQSVDENKKIENGVTKDLANDDEKDSDNKMDTDDNEDDDDDFNPLLLCPDISMDVEESPVLTGTTESSRANDPSDPNSLFAPLFSTFVDEMTGAEISFNLTAEEQQLREKLYGPNNPIQFSKIHCTACNVHLGSALAGQTNRFVHPLLKVLICKECYHFYTSGEFEKDEDGSELYCRWCGQGGQVLCCTMCEFVFCKKCIRINFGRKKLTQVRDSDEWKCFRCDMSQLKALRAMCVEFFEYIRRETARAATYSDSDIVNKDLTNCCQAQAKKRSADSDKEGEKEVVKKPKRRKTDEDPDYNPFSQNEDVPNSPVPSTSGIKSAANVTKPIVPKPMAPRNEVTVPAQLPTATVRIGNQVINVKSLGNPPQAANPVPPLSRNTAIRAPVLPPSIRIKPHYAPRTVVPITNVRPAVMASPGSMAHIRATSKAPQSVGTPMKHEWFEKTVRAAARVNSNLSYTLTQLNKAQSSAGSVEQLAVVHNKLQEILSSSINSLIQIRKNLRTEFIAGIKTFKFPPKPSAVDPNDDDVIIVNPEPRTSSNASKHNRGGPPVPALVSMKKQATPTTPNRSISNKSMTNNSTPNKGYLKVRSFQQLQTVSSECITIPDDDPPPPKVEIDPISVEVTEDSASEKENSENSKKTTGSETDDVCFVEDCNTKNENDNDKVEAEETDKGDTENPEKGDTENPEKGDTENPDKGDTENPERGDTENPEKGDTENPEKVESVADIDKENTESADENDINENGQTENSNDSEKNENENSPQNGEKETNEQVEKGNGKDDDTVSINENSNGSNTNDSEKCNGEVVVKTEPTDSYNVKDQPSPKIRRMLSVKVNLKKTPIVENLVKQEPLENGDN